MSSRQPISRNARRAAVEEHQRVLEAARERLRRRFAKYEHYDERTGILFYDDPPGRARHLPGLRNGRVDSVVVAYNDNEDVDPHRPLKLTAYVTVEAEPTFNAQVDFETVDGVRLIWSVTLDTTQDGLAAGGITWQSLRGLPLDAIQREVDAILAREESRCVIPTYLLGELGVRPGRAGRDDVYYAQAALLYTQLLGENRVLEAMGRALGITQTQARDLVSSCRRRGFLTPTTRGQRGGSLTEYARQVLAEYEE